MATDADLAGRLAAEKDHWLLSQHNLVPLMATFPLGSDPSGLLEQHGPETLSAALSNNLPLAEILLEERLDNLPARSALVEATTVLATDSPQRWDAGCAAISSRLGITEDQARQALSHAVQAWHQDPRLQVADQLSHVRDVRTRLETAAEQSSEQRWSTIARKLDPRLPHQDGWPALARMMQDLHDRGLNVRELARQLIADVPLADRPAQDLRYRLTAVGRPAPKSTSNSEARSRLTGAEHTRREKSPVRWTPRSTTAR